MIGYIEGKIISKKPDKVILLTGGIGYEIFIPYITFKQLKEKGETDFLYIHTIHNDSAFNLYGFKTEEEKEFFKLLISISGIGPKVALTVLSRAKVEDLKVSIIKNDVSFLTSISGIGKKTAQKIVFELKEKLKQIYGKDYEKVIKTERNEIIKDVITALESLGWSRQNSLSVVNEIEIEKNDSLEDIIKKCLQKLSRL